MSVAEIPATEFAERRARLAAGLANRKIHSWVAYGDDRQFAGANHVRYLSNLHPHFEPVLLLGGSDGCVSILTGPESVGYSMTATEGTGIHEVAAMKELLHPGLEYKSVPLLMGYDAVLKRLQGSTRLGVIGWDNLPSHLVQRLATPLQEAGVELVDVSDVVYELRAIKSGSEHAVLDRAFEIAGQGMRAAARAIRPGATERSVAAAAEAVAREAGAEGFGIDTMVSAGVEHTRRVLARTTFRQIQKGDLVTVTLGPRYAGYHAAVARAFILGPNRQLERMVGVARTAQSKARDALRAGQEGRAATIACSEVIRNGETDATIVDVWVHSTGVVEFEPPVFDVGATTLVAEGMSINLDVPLFEAPWGGLRLEDGFAVENGLARPRIKGYEDLVPLIL
jgi:Xaa-Pro aminopeptidase